MASQKTLRDSSPVSNSLPAEVVAHRVDAEGGVVHEEDPRRAAPQQRGQAAADRAGHAPRRARRRRRAERDPEHERPVHEADPGVGEQVLGVALLVGDLHVGEHPADVRVHEAPQLTAPAVALVEVRAVRVAVLDRRTGGACGGWRPSRSPGPRPRPSPSAAKPARTMRWHLKLRWVSRRWKPTVIAGPDHHVEDGQDEQVLPDEQAVVPAQPHAEQHEDRRYAGDHGAGQPVDERHLDRSHGAAGRPGRATDRRAARVRRPVAGGAGRWGRRGPC